MRIYLISSKGSVSVLSITAKEKSDKEEIRGSEYLKLNICTSKIIVSKGKYEWWTIIIPYDS